MSANDGDAASGAATGGIDAAAPTPGPASDSSSKTKPTKKTIAIIAAAVVAAIVIAIGVGVYIHRSKENAYNTALTACNDATAKLKESKTTMGKSQKAAQEAAKTKSDDLSDASTLDDLKKLPGTGEGSTVNDLTRTAPTTDNDSDDSYSCSPDLTANILSDHANYMNDEADEYTDVAKKFNKATKAVNKSKEEKTSQTAKSTLQNAISDAQSMLSRSNGKVTDNATRTALQQAIDAAKKTLDSSDSDAAAMTRATSNLKAAISKVSDSMQAKEKSDAQKKAQEQAAAADKTRCVSIAGTYGMWQGSPQLTVSADCSATQSDVTGGGGWSGTYVANSYQSGTWKLSNGKTLTYYPAGTTSPWIKQYLASTGGGPGPSQAQIETSDGTPYVRLN
ncbi:hypothetical protein GFD17_01350 [Bifidobacterium sp. SMB2]|uniref:Colicin transporter n=1 Tax=Bifidobacterium saimiriisciurei TaxID=2661627 RepID=A0ABX0CER5_9BIFI|nr:MULTISPECIES: hypothetical protein [Bifidobacterium]NEG95422.1 hypothetical protein [Bifidobacterium sp. SMB2]NEH11394.1 hypothetical protein [Bifidobacterium saimiriisciurei]